MRWQAACVNPPRQAHGETWGKYGNRMRPAAQVQRESAQDFRNRCTSPERKRWDLHIPSLALRACAGFSESLHKPGAQATGPTHPVTGAPGLCGIFGIAAQARSASDGTYTSRRLRSGLVRDFRNRCTSPECQRRDLHIPSLALRACAGFSESLHKPGAPATGPTHPVACAPGLCGIFGIARTGCW